MVGKRARCKVCKEKRPERAVHDGDPYCSRKCCEEDLGTAPPHRRRASSS